jgi:hypothetical protein
VGRVEIKNMLLNNIKESLKSAPNSYNIEIKIKNLNEALNIASILLGELKNNEEIDDILHYIELSFIIPISSQKLYIMSYFYEIYDDMFFASIENNEENISESQMKIFVSVFDFRDVKKHNRRVSKEHFEQKLKLIEEIFVRNSVSAKKVYFEGTIDGFEFVYPLDTEVFWFLI